MTGMQMPMGGLPPVPTSDPSVAGLGGGGPLGQGAPLPPPGLDPSMMGAPGAAPAPQYPSTDPQSLASLVAQAISQAQGADQAQFAQAQQAAEQGAMEALHPIVQGMMAAQQGDPNRGMTQDAMAPSMPDPGAPMAMGGYGQ